MFEHPGGILQETRRDEIRNEIHEALGIEISKDDDEEDEDEEGGGAMFTYASMVWDARPSTMLPKKTMHTEPISENILLGG